MWQFWIEDPAVLAFILGERETRGDDGEDGRDDAVPVR